MTMIPQLFMKEEVTRMVYHVGEFTVTDYISDEHGRLDTVVTGPLHHPWVGNQIITNPETLEMINYAFRNYDQS